MRLSATGAPAGSVVLPMALWSPSSFNILLPLGLGWTGGLVEVFGVGEAGVVGTFTCDGAGDVCGVGDGNGDGVTEGKEGN